ncbi:MAG: DUF4391 domain-containing protein, partial [Candidatus Omnitrophica bacterium]|nr:DUF4391 domain-containing protein [Candidatus Omnitrophota bacterium]
IRPNERFKEFMNRLDILKVKEKDMFKLNARIKKEKQFNRKVEINMSIHALKAEIEELKNSDIEE